jgi:hypothetical protein
MTNTPSDELAGARRIFAITREFERLWGEYIAKLARVDELRAAGRHGYQLKMPKRSRMLAANRLEAFCRANGVASPLSAGEHYLARGCGKSWQPKIFS